MLNFYMPRVMRGMKLTITIDKLWSVEFYTRRNVLKHERKVQKHEAKLDVSNIFLSASKYF